MHDDTGRRLYQCCFETCEVLLVAILTTVIGMEVFHVKEHEQQKVNYVWLMLGQHLYSINSMQHGCLPVSLCRPFATT